MSAHQPEEFHPHWTERFNAGDLDGLVEMYEPGAAIAQPEGMYTGTEAIRENLSTLLGMHGTMVTEPKRTIHSGDIALLLSSWTMTAPTPDGTAITITGQTTDVVRRQADGSWRIVIDNPYGNA
jgi:ketosteroid isomerase-like protein